MQKKQLITAILLVGLGGFLGSVSRYLLSTITIKGTFPFITFLTNFAGAVLIGFIVEFSYKIFPLSPNLMLFLKTGLCGGFTTFSTFSLETITLLENNHIKMSICYTVLSVFICLIGILIGKTLVHTL